MWQTTEYRIERHLCFFLICLSHDTLANNLETNFVLMNSRDYDLGNLDKMIPYEREIYIAMLINYLDEQLQKALNG